MLAATKRRSSPVAMLSVSAWRGNPRGWSKPWSSANPTRCASCGRR